MSTRRSLMSWTAVIAVLCSACVVVPRYLQYKFYEPQLAAAVAAQCAQCGSLEIARDHTTIVLRYKGSGNTLSVTTYDVAGYRGLLDQASDHFSITSRKTREVSFWLSIQCSGSERWSFRPGKIQLFDARGHDLKQIPLWRFTEHVPGTLHPDNGGTSEWVRIDRGDAIECLSRQVRSVTAVFDFDPALTELQFSFADSLSVGDTKVDVPVIRLTLRSNKEFIEYTKEPLFVL